MNRVVTNLILFKLGWVACVMLAASGKPLLATLAVALVASLHLLSVPVVVKEALLLMAAAFIGLGWETLLVSTGLVQYPTVAATGAIAPHWIVAMWVLFATTVNHGLRWVKKHWAVSVLAGWAMLLPVLVWIADTIIDSPLLEPPLNRSRHQPELQPLPIFEGSVQNGA